MKKLLFAALFTSLLTFPGFAQKFNRSLTDFSLYPHIILNHNGKTYVSGGGFKFWKFGETGNTILKSSLPTDSFIYISFSLIKETDSTFISSGMAIDTTWALPYRYSYLTRLDTSFNVLSTRVLMVDSSVLNEHNVHLTHHGQLLLNGGRELFVLDKNFTVLNSFKNINTQDFNILGIPLRGDSILTQRSNKSGIHNFLLVDMGDSTEVDITSGLNLNPLGTVALSDYSDSSFCILNNRGTSQPVEVRFYRKSDLSFLHSFNIDSAAGFPVFEIKTFEDGIIGTSRDGRFVILTGAYPFSVITDSLKTRDMISEVGQPACYLSDSLVVFGAKMYTCQTHIESFPLNQRADDFGGVNLKSIQMSGQILGNAKPISQSSEYVYRVEATIDFWIENASSNFMDSLTVSYGQLRAGAISKATCIYSDKLKYDGINLLPSDSVHVSFTDTFYVYTQDTNQASLMVGMSPIAANGNIVYTSGIDTAYQKFEGMSLIKYPSDEHFSVYPSPAKDYLSLEISGGETIQKATVFTIDGKPLSTYTGNTPKMKISVAGLERGLYLLHFQTDESSYSKLFYKE